MFAKFITFFAFIVLAQAGNEQPPPKVHSYSVPQLAKVEYPAPTVHRNIETYSAPSIEKTTTIIRTITAPINAPAEKSVTYHAPGGPAIAGGVIQPAVQYAQGLPAGIQFAHHAGLEAYAQPIAYQAGAFAHQGSFVPQGAFAHQAPIAAYSAGVPIQAYNSFGFDNLGSVYAAPQFGYQLGQVAAHGVPVAVHQAAQPVAVQSLKEGY